MGTHGSAQHHKHVSVFRGPKQVFAPGLTIHPVAGRWAVADELGELGQAGALLGQFGTEAQACREALRLLRQRHGRPLFACWGAGAPNEALQELGYARGKARWRWWPPEVRARRRERDWRGWRSAALRERSRDVNPKTELGFWSLPRVLIDRFPEVATEVKKQFEAEEKAGGRPQPHAFLEAYLLPLASGQRGAGARTRAFALLEELLNHQDEDLVSAAILNVVEPLASERATLRKAMGAAGPTTRSWLDRRAVR